MSTSPIQPASDELLEKVTEAAKLAVTNKTPLTIKPATMLAITTRLAAAETQQDLKDELSEANNQLEEAKEQLSNALAELEDIRPEPGTIQLDICSLGHPADEIAAEKLEEWLNRVGLDTAAQHLGLVASSDGAGHNQLSLAYSTAA